MSRPTEGTDTPRPSAISGSMPMTTNSVVPMPKAPMARAIRARGTAELLGTTARTRSGRTASSGWALREDPLQEARPRPGPTCQGRRVGLLTRSGSRLEQHLDRAVPLLAEVRVGLRCLLERHVVGGVVVDAQ